MIIPTVSLALTLLGLPVTHFDGGTPEQLAAAFSGSLKTPVVIQSSKTYNLKPFDYDSASISTASRALRSLGFNLEGGVGAVFSDERFPQANFPAFFNSPEPTPSSIELPVAAFASGNVTFDTGGKPPVLVSSIAKLPWTKPFKLNKLFDLMVISITANDLPEATFLDMFKKSVGGTWVETDGVRSLEPDASLLRIRLQNTLAAKTEVDPGDKALEYKKAIYLAAVQTMDDDTVAHLFSAADGKAKLAIVPNSDLAQAIVAYIEYLASNEEKQPLGQRTPMKHLLEHVDSRRAATGAFWADGNLQITVPTYDPQTKVADVTIVQ